MKTSHGGFRMLRREQLLQEVVHDSYKAKGKLPEPAHCPDCGAVYHRGSWRWGAPEKGSQPHVCSACHRIRDSFPAGYLTIQGEFFGTHRDEIVALARNCETREKAEHPMQRIMAIDPDGEGLIVTTTDPHLARSIGEALHHAYQGKLEYHYNKEDNLLRVLWRH